MLTTQFQIDCDRWLAKINGQLAFLDSAFTSLKPQISVSGFYRRCTAPLSRSAGRFETPTQRNSNLSLAISKTC